MRQIAAKHNANISKFVAVLIGLLSMFNNYNKNDEVNKEVGEPDELDLLFETFKLRTHDIPDDNVNSLFGKNKKMDRLIVMDNVSGVAYISKKIANFLTVSRKFGYHCIYVFHVIAPATQIYFLKQTFSTFFHLASLKLLLQKFYRVTALHNQKNMFQYVLCGLIGLLLI